MRKANSNSKLKTLPAEMQDTIFEWCSQDSLESAVARCAAELISPKTGGPLLTNIDSMSKFFEWYPDASHFRKITQKVKRQTDLLKTVDPAASAEKLQAFGQLAFMDLAMEAKNTQDFVSIVGEGRKERELNAKIEGFRLRYAQKERENALEREKFELLKQKAEQAKETVDNPKLSDAEVAERMRRIFA